MLVWALTVLMTFPELLMIVMISWVGILALGEWPRSHKGGMSL